MHVARVQPSLTTQQELDLNSIGMSGTNHDVLAKRVGIGIIVDSNTMCAG
jgi:hypothetical protein